MCGIILWIGDAKDSCFHITDLIHFAHENGHRGGDDGFGYVNFDVESDSKLLGMRKTLLSIAEVEGETVNPERYTTTVEAHTKNPKTGVFTYTKTPVINERKKIALNETIGLIQDENNFTNAIALHYRQGTTGENKMENTHPILIESKDVLSGSVYYMQNGTTYVKPIRKALNMWKDKQFNGDTDTEVLGNLIETFIEDGMEVRNVPETLKEWFYEIGVILRIVKYMDGSATIDIFKDDSRSLYFCQHNAGFMFLSELSGDLIYNLDFSMVEEVVSGHARVYLPEGSSRYVSIAGMKMVDKTDNYNLIKQMIMDDKSDSLVSPSDTCDICEKKKRTIIRMPGSNDDFCFDCIISWEEGVKNRFKRLVNLYADYEKPEPYTKGEIAALLKHGKIASPSLMFSRLSENPIGVWLAG